MTKIIITILYVLIFCDLKSQIPVLDWEIVNSIGQIAYQEIFKAMENHSVQIDISKFSKGIYFVRLKTLPEQVYNKKVVIK